LSGRSGLNGYIFEKLLHRAFVIVRPHGRHSEIEMDEGEVGIGPLGALELGEGLLRFFRSDSFTQDQVKLCCVASDFHQAVESFSSR